ncbi:LOW QUALITY PROTEIN: krab-a domain-containing protein [Vespula maculifrons]|uniref:Krab-a domain-containing protein n=1 Tax=Vespula maculifrons TaxID=7453 RepID=A0ABD2C7S4_VESMC
MEMIRRGNLETYERKKKWWNWERRGKTSTSLSNQSSLQEENSFVSFYGWVNGKVCTFLLDTGSDASLSRSKKLRSVSSITFAGLYIRKIRDDWIVSSGNIVGGDLRVPLGLLVCLEKDISHAYGSRLRTKLDEIRRIAKERMKIKFCKMKVWLFKPQRRKEKAEKLENNLQGSYKVLKQINDIIFCIGKFSKEKNKIVYLDRLAPFIERSNSKKHRVNDLNIAQRQGVKVNVSLTLLFFDMGIYTTKEVPVESELAPGTSGQEVVTLAPSRDSLTQVCYAAGLMSAQGSLSPPCVYDTTANNEKAPRNTSSEGKLSPQRVLLSFIEVSRLRLRTSKHEGSCGKTEEVLSIVGKSPLGKDLSCRDDNYEKGCQCYKPA